MAGRGIVVPATPNVVDEPVAAQDANAYPGGVGDLAAQRAPSAEAANTDAPVEVAPSRTGATPAPQAARPDLRRVIGELFAPPPPMRLVVLHVRAQNDAIIARAIAADLIKAGNVRAIIDVMPPGDPRQSGYAYFDGRQSRPAAALVTQFHDTARAHQVAEWSAQLRGIALPAQGEYTADRLDIVLPSLPAAPAPEPQRIDPRAARPPG